MYILALETTGPHASVAMIDEMGTVTQKSSQEIFTHLEQLMPMTQEILSEIGVTAADITAVAASKGPGSFTGIRIGVSSARALSQMLDIPTIGVPTLNAFAYNIKDYRGLICPILDARREQVYGGAYRWIDGRIIEVVKGAPYRIQEFLEQIDGEAMFFGDGVKVYKDHLTERDLAPESLRLQTAESVARFALNLYQNGETFPYEELKPDYMRQPEAERKLKEKTNDRINHKAGG